MAHYKLESRGLANFMDHEFGRTVNTTINQKFEVGLVFLILPMGDALSENIIKVYKSECTRLGLHALCGKDAPQSGIILKYIVDMIEKAEFIICDLSKARQNVYYELGYAHGVGNQSNRVFLTACVETQFHFDISSLRIHVYNDIDELRQIMRAAFKMLIKESRRETPLNI